MELLLFSLSVSRSSINRPYYTVILSPPNGSSSHHRLHILPRLHPRRYLARSSPFSPLRPPLLQGPPLFISSFNTSFFNTLLPQFKFNTFSFFSVPKCLEFRQLYLTYVVFHWKSRNSKLYELFEWVVLSTVGFSLSMFRFLVNLNCCSVCQEMLERKVWSFTFKNWFFCLFCFLFLFFLFSFKVRSWVLTAALRGNLNRMIVVAVNGWRWKGPALKMMV